MSSPVRPWINSSADCWGGRCVCHVSLTALRLPLCYMVVWPGAAHPDPMLFTKAFTSQALAAKLESLVDLSTEERSSLGALPIRQVDVSAGELICRAGDQPSSCFIVLEGFVSLSKETAAGTR